MKRTLTLIAAVSVVALLAACSPTDVSLQHFPQSKWSAARCIIHHESGGNPRATGGAGERGLFQIHPVHRSTFQQVTGRPWSAAYEPGPNGQFAAWMQARQGWRPPRRSSQPSSVPSPPLVRSPTLPLVAAELLVATRRARSATTQALAAPGATHAPKRLPSASCSPSAAARRSLSHPRSMML